MRRLLSLVIASAALLGASGGADARVDVTDTLLLSQPATSGQHVAFIYAGDLWTARLDGSDVRRLTTDDGQESSPAFSPDGARIAFSAQYEGNTDVYVVPAQGGVPVRLTWHPGADLVQGFTADGKSVLFTSARAVFTTRFTQLFTVPVDGGVEEALPIPNAARATYSPDGRRIAYNPLGPAFLQWKHYRGGRTSRIWLYETRRSRRRARPAAARPRERRGSDVGGRHGVLPLRSQRRVQPVRLRHEDEGDPAADPARRLSRPQRVGRRRADRLRAGGPAARARSRRARRRAR